MSTKDPANNDAIQTGQQGVGFLVSITARSFTHKFDDALRPYGLDHMRLIVIRNVTRYAPEHPDGVPVSLLAEKLVIPSHTLADQGRSLAYTGWLSVRGSGAETRLLPTRKAENMLPVLVDATRWTYQEALNGVSREEIDSLTSVLQRVMLNFGLEVPRQD